MGFAPQKRSTEKKNKLIFWKGRLRFRLKRCQVSFMSFAIHRKKEVNFERVDCGSGSNTVYTPLWVWQLLPPVVALIVYCLDLPFSKCPMECEWVTSIAWKVSDQGSVRESDCVFLPGKFGKSWIFILTSQSLHFFWEIWRIGRSFSITLFLFSRFLFQVQGLSVDGYSFSFFRLLCFL